MLIPISKYQLKCVITYLILTVITTFSISSYGQVSFAFLDISSGIFRFQIKLAQQGNAEAQYKVGEMYEAGKGVSLNKTNAKLWFKKAAAKGHEKATYKMLYLDISENGLNAFSKTQLDKIRHEASSDNANAQYFLGKMYVTGVGVAKNLSTAMQWLNKAKYNGSVEAEYEAIAVLEKLDEIKASQSKRRAAVVAAARKKKFEQYKAQFIKNKTNRERLEKQDLQRRNDARKLAEKTRQLKEKKRQVLEKQKQVSVKPQHAVVQKEVIQEKAEETRFESDPCKGKKARFLSTCRK